MVHFIAGTGNTEDKLRTSFCAKNEGGAQKRKCIRG
jgi:hypothetical protein